MRLARNVASAFTQLKFALGSIDKQMERFAQYDMDGLADLDLNDVLDALDRQAPLLGSDAAGKGIERDPPAASVVAAAVPGGVAGTGTGTGAAVAVSGATGREIGAREDETNGGGDAVDWVKLAADSRKAADAGLSRFVSEY